MLPAVDLLQGDHVGVELLGSGGHVLRPHLAVHERPPVQQVPGGDPQHRHRCRLARQRARRAGSAGQRTIAASAACTIASNVRSRSSAEVSSPVTRLSLTVQTAAARAPNFAASV